MRKKQKRLETEKRDRLNSDFAMLVVLGSYFPSSKVVPFLYPCSSVCIRGFKALTQLTRVDIAAAILAEAGRGGAAAPAPRRGIPRATAPRGAQVRAGRNRVGDSRYESRVRHAGACRRILLVRAASNRFRRFQIRWSCGPWSRGARARPLPEFWARSECTSPFHRRGRCVPAADEAVRGRTVPRARSPSRLHSRRPRRPRLRWSLPAGRVRGGGSAP